MKSIAIFEDNKGFTKVLEFAQLPHMYKFIERVPPTASTETDINKIPWQHARGKEVRFYPEGDSTEAYGIKTQKYYQA